MVPRLDPLNMTLGELASLIDTFTAKYQKFNIKIID